MTSHPARWLGPAAAAALLAGPVCAEPPEAGGRAIVASTRLHRCGADTCLVVTGRRSDPAAPVLLAGHDVVAEGGRRWRVAVPLREVRAWSAPSARAIAVEVAGRDGGRTEAALPIGVFGHVTQLAFLSVSARR